jgi:hypothetical protein
MEVQKKETSPTEAADPFLRRLDSAAVRRVNFFLRGSRNGAMKQLQFGLLALAASAALGYAVRRSSVCGSVEKRRQHAGATSTQQAGRACKRQRPHAQATRMT